MKTEIKSMTTGTLSHDWQEETIEAKALWFQSLSFTERMDLLCWFTDLILLTNPRILILLFPGDENTQSKWRSMKSK